MVQFVTDMTPTLLIQPFSGKIAAPHISVCVPGLPTADNKSQVTEEWENVVDIILLLVMLWTLSASAASSLYYFTLLISQFSLSFV